jgi:hypothetical protein
MDKGELHMPITLIFNFCQALALIGWLVLVTAPADYRVHIGVARGIAVVLAIAYLAQLLFNTVPVEGGDFMSIIGITALFSQPANVMLGWTHFLAFDLFIGSWIVADARDEGVTHWAIIPILIATLMIGPVGLMIWYGVRALHRLRVGAKTAKALG